MEKIGAYTERTTEGGEWRPGTPLTGQQATPMLASYFNMMQRELVTVVESAGLDLDVEDDGQLLQAIQKLISASALDTLNTVRVNVASASTVNLTTDAANTRHITVTGGTTIRGFTVAAGRCYFVRFSGALRLASGAALVTPHGTDIITVAGDSCIIRATSENVVEVFCFSSSASTAGTVCHFAQSTAPAGWLKANGAAVSRNTYSTLFAAIGTTFGAGDGSTTFNLPDMRGEFIRGWDDNRGIETDRVLGSNRAAQSNNLTQVYFDLEASAAGTITIPQDGSWSGFVGASRDDRMRFRLSGLEPYPRNIALLACIQY